MVLINRKNKQKWIEYWFDDAIEIKRKLEITKMLLLLRNSSRLGEKKRNKLMKIQFE